MLPEIRSSGLLAPIFSLPFAYDLGTIGRPTDAFLQFLVRAKQSWWQMLPLNPVRGQGSPYDSLSAFAGETLYLDPDDMVEQAFLDKDDLDAWRPNDGVKLTRRLRKERFARADYARARDVRTPKFQKAFDRWRRKLAGDKLRAREEEFRAQNDYWLEDCALYQTAAEVFRSYDWTSWPDEIRRRDRDALREFARVNADGVEFRIFLQFLFDCQWKNFREKCRRLGVKLFGDLPLYIGRNSADAWTRPELFMLDANGAPLREAGVPTDDFNPKGQPWGSPTYRWSAHRREDFEWWKRRMIKTLERFDLVRLDHFIGFFNYYSFQTSSEPCPEWDAEKRDAFANGAKLDYEKGWTPGPQVAFFDAIFSICPKDAFVAEDLGVLNDGVFALRDKYDLPGMDVLQFSLDYLKVDPKTGKVDDPTRRWKENAVAYLGTHDSAPTLGWLDDIRLFGGKDRWQKVNWSSIRRLLQTRERPGDLPAIRKKGRPNKPNAANPPALGIAKHSAPLPFEVARLRAAAIRIVADSRARIAVFPIQDVLGMSNDARVNYPGVAERAWRWRMPENALDQTYADDLAKIVEETGRLPSLDGAN